MVTSRTPDFSTTTNTSNNEDISHIDNLVFQLNDEHGQHIS